MHMHRRKLVHGDVKPENLLLCSSKSDADASIKLCDFGMTRPFIDGRPFPFSYTCGTFDYWAPEVTPSTLNPHPPPSTLNPDPQPLTLDPRSSTLNPQPSTPELHASALNPKPPD